MSVGPGVELHLGDCLEVMKSLPGGSVDAVVTDPPAGIGFMGEEWDTAKGGRDAWVAWLRGRMTEALRVTRPGGHALVWALPRTSHWTGMALEDAGWVIEDRIAHHFGQGFPKHKSKLKPATEDWWLCTKPGGRKWLNIDGCRVGLAGIESHRTNAKPGLGKHGIYGNTTIDEIQTDGPTRYDALGRWPANVVLSHHPDCRPAGTKRVRTGLHVGENSAGKEIFRTVYSKGMYESGTNRGYADSDGMETVVAWECVPTCPVAEMDRQSGPAGRLGPDHVSRTALGLMNDDAWQPRPTPSIGYGDSGGASRFFPTFSYEADDFAPFLYCPKASRAERGEGNTHPTVKPLALMRWLCRLVTPPGGTILDPFAGSGSTLLAAVQEGFRAVGIEGEAEYFTIAERRLKAHTQQGMLL